MKYKIVINLFICFSILLGLMTVHIPPVYAAGLVVNTNADNVISGDGFCTLREAINNANNDNDSTSNDCKEGSGADSITFAANYTITLHNSQLPDVTTQITITGTGAANTIIQASTCNPITLPGGCTPANYRVFQVTSQGDLTLNNLTVQHGHCGVESCISGGGIRNFFGSLTVTNSVISNNLADIGGGITNLGFSSTVTVTNTTVSGNSANGGGGIYNSFTNATLTNVTFNNNSATAGGGGGVLNESTNPLIADVAFTGNSAPYGGGVFNQASNPTITNTTFSNNSAGDYGGGIYNSLSNPIVTNTTFSNNSAGDYGGGMMNVSDSSPIVTNTSFTSNSAIYGGGVYNQGSSPTLTNVTLSNNSATIQGGGMYSNSTSVPTLKNVIIANSASGGDCGLDFSSSLSAASVNNLIESTGIHACGLTNGVNGNIIGSDPNLGALTGSPAYFPLNAGSPAFDAGSNTGCPNTSQNGVTRPQGAACDIGSYELPASDPSPTILSITRASTNPTSATSVDFAVVFSEVVTGVDVNDFSISKTGSITGESVTNVSGTGGSYTVTVNTGSGNGTIRLDVPNTATISDLSSNALSGLPFTGGEVYSVDKSGGTLPTSPTFGDAPMNHPYWQDIEILYANGFTGGCSASPLLFCPDTTMDRAQGAVFMLRGLVGTSYVPPVEPFANPFGDSWSPGPWAQRWAQGMLDEGLTAGCSVSPLLYCPWEQMPRAQAAVFGMRLLNGSAYLPPAGTGTVFADINGSEWYAGWAEQAYLNGLLPACGMQGSTPLFCPNNLVSRGLGAYMIVRAKNLSMP